MRVLDWRLEQSGLLARQMGSNPAELQRYFADLASTRSEIAARELQLQRAGIDLMPPAEWQPRR